MLIDISNSIISSATYNRDSAVACRIVRCSVSYFGGFDTSSQFFTLSCMFIFVGNSFPGEDLLSMSSLCSGVLEGSGARSRGGCGGGGSANPLYNGS